MTKKKSKAYADTSISVDKSGADIAKILRAAGARTIQWDWDGPKTTLRFIWKVGGVELPARFAFEAKVDSRVRTRKPRGMSYVQDRDRRVEKESMRLHRVLHWYLKTVFEAEEAGLLRSDAALLGWIEDSAGVTVAERLIPGIASLATTELKALSAGRGQ